MAEEFIDIEQDIDEGTGDPKPKPKLPGMGGKPQLPGLEKKKEYGGFSLGSFAEFGKQYSPTQSKLPSQKKQGIDFSLATGDGESKESMLADLQKAQTQKRELPFKTADEAKDYLTTRLVEKQAKLRPKKELATNITQETFRKPEDVTSRTLDEFDLGDISESLKDNVEKKAFDIYQQDRNKKAAVTRYGITEDAALRYAASQGDKDAARMLQKPLVSRKKLESVVGSKMMDFLYDEDVVKMAEQNPELKQKWIEKNEKLFDEYPTLAKKIVSQKIGQYREDKGVGGLLVDIPSKEGLDRLVSDMMADGKLDEKELGIYQKEIRPDVGVGKSILRGFGNTFIPAFTSDAPIQTTDYLGSLQDSYKNTVRSMAHSVEDIVNLNPANPIQFDTKARTDDIINREYLTPTVEAKGDLSKAFQGAGHLTGFVVPMILGGEAKIPELVTSALTFGGINEDAALRMFPDNKLKQAGYTALTTGFDVFAGKYLLPKNILGNAKSEFSKEISGLINKFSNKELDAATAKTTALKIGEDILKKYVPDLAKGNVKTATVLGAFNVFHNGVDAAFGGRDVSFDDAAHEATESFKVNLLAATPLSAAAVYGKYSKTTARTLREAAQNRDYFKEKMHDDIALDPQSAPEKTEAIRNLDVAAGINNDVKDLNISEKQKDKYVLHGVVENIWKKKAEATTDTNLKEQYIQKAKDAKSVKEQILKGNTSEEIVPESKQKEIEEQKKAKIELERLEVDHKLELEKIDAQIEKTDGRESEENRIKLKELNEKKKRAKEDFEKEKSKLNDQQATIQDIPSSQKTEIKTEEKVTDPSKTSTVSGWEVGDILPADQQRPEKKIKTIGKSIGDSMVKVEFEDGTKGAIPKDKAAYLKQLSDENKTEVTSEEKPSSLKDLYDKYDNGDIGSFGDLVEQVESYAKENGNENLLAAVDKYRREQEYDRSISGRGDWDAMEKEFTNVIESEIKSPSTVSEREGVSKFPKPSKPINELSSDELYEYSNTVMEYGKNLEKEYFGEEGARKYKEARRISNSPTSSREDAKEADRVMKEMEESLTEAQQNEFFGIGFDKNGLYDAAEISNLASKVRLIEEAENVQDIARSLKLPLLEFSKSKEPSVESLTMLSAANKKAQELGISTEDLIKKSLNNIAKDLPDKTDAVFLAKTIFDKLIKPTEAVPPKQITNETITKESSESPESIPSVQEPSTKKGATEPSKSAEQVENQGAEPPKEPPTVEASGKENEGGQKKGVLNHLYTAENIPESAREGFKKEGLEYKTASQEEAHQVAKSVIDELGIDEAVNLAEAQKFDGDVNSLIYAESLNRLAEKEASAKTPQEKLEAAKQFAEVGIMYDNAGRKGGRFSSAINYFYKKSPLGVVMIENAKRKQNFEEWAKPKDKSWKEFFDELVKEPEFEKLFKEEVKTELKKERAEARKTRKDKADKFFDDAKGKDALYATIIPKPFIDAAIEGMRKAYHAGEKVAELVQDAIDFISEKMGTAPWDKEKFRKEWEEKLKDRIPKEKISDEDLKAKVLDKFRKKLKGLTEDQKDDVIRQAHKKLIENGALDFEDFKNIIARVVGRTELSVEEANRMKELVAQTNKLEEAANRAREERTPAAFQAYRDEQVRTAKATRVLNDMFFNKPDIIRRITGIMQLNTLGIVSLINNPVYNIMNQAGVRFPVGVINDLADRGIKLIDKNYEQEYNTFETQKDFWEMVGVGGKEAAEQLLTGLNRSDYTQKELYSEQIRPFKALRELWASFKGEKKLTKRQKIDKMLQGTVGIPAEAVARMLNIGDKPQRFAAGGAQGAAFAKSLGLKEMDKKLFMEFPREEAYRAYKAQGLGDAVAGQKADYIKQVMEKEGQRSTFQQDNLLNDVISAAFGKLFGGKDTGAAALAKTLTISPYIKIPSNAFWSMYNLLNPEIAILQATVHGARSGIASKKGDVNKSKLQLREARYWLAHAIVGMGTRAAVIALVQQGLFTPSLDDDDPKKEREAVNYFDKQGTMQIGNLKVSNRWLGQFGMLANQIAKQHQDLTPEQRENMDEFWNVVLGGMEKQGLQELENGVFGNSSSLLQYWFGKGDLNRYFTNTTNLFTNIIQPASLAQLNRAALDEVPTSKGDTFLDTVNQNFAQRSVLYRKLFDVQIKYKRNLWGEKQPKGGNILSRMFGISKADPQLFARPLYDDFLRTNDAGFLPPAISPTLNGQKLNTKESERLQEYVGQERKRLVEPYINDMAIIDGFGKRYSQLKDDEAKKRVLDYLYDYGRLLGLRKFYSDYPQFLPKGKTENQQEFDELFNEFKQGIKDENPIENDQ